MAKVKIYNLAGQAVETIEISDKVFALPANDELVHQAYVALAGNRRQVLADTKTRGERAGSGIKPWRQKGTGRARVGSVRTPVWRKGGVAFGPTSDRNFKKKINNKMNVKAIKTVLSGKLKDQQLVVVDKMELTENKTKAMAESLKNLKIIGRTLICFTEGEKGVMRLTRNIDKIKNIPISQLNVKEMLDNKQLLISKDSIKFLEDKYGQ